MQLQPYNFLSLPSQSMIVFAKPIKFALLFTFGNVLAVGSTTFLIGAGKQMRMMFDSARVYATAIYLGCVVLALICAFWVKEMAGFAYNPLGLDHEDGLFLMTSV
ncbi:Vesicle transport protein SFT2B [Morus notabilis]|uniref:Vesicle transport protein n=1 Tax=Morus notabilis TaxID=981085 RepID=W9RSF2_9ROSA|nr:Vesicle transport protein SFT2B [Morus notabilis]